MNLGSRIAGLVGMGLGVVLLGAGCESIAGIEERHLGLDQACVEYCGNVMTNCVDEHSVYAQAKVCEAVCPHFDKGTTLESPDGGNTLACRSAQAELAERESTVCEFAGPGGGSACGGDCAGYCHLFSQICPKEFGNQTQEKCVEQCGALARAAEFNAAEYSTGDTLDCRLIHVSAAAVDPTTHCPHVAVVPKDAKQPCTNPVDEAPTCADYCRISLTACVGTRRVYDSMAECEAACVALLPGTNADTGVAPAGDEEAPQNTVGCRKYHSYSSLKDPVTHCPHSGPTGDGHCGGAPAICESYCQLAKGACPTAYALKYEDDTACQEECADLPGAEYDAHYAVETAEASDGPEISCRVLHAVRAFSKPLLECDSALGGGDCLR